MKFAPKNRQIFNITKLAKQINPARAKIPYVNYGKKNLKIGMPPPIAKFP